MSEPSFEAMYDRYREGRHATISLPDPDQVRAWYAAQQDPVAKAVRACVDDLVCCGSTEDVTEGVHEHLGPWLPPPAFLRALREWWEDSTNKHGELSAPGDRDFYEAIPEAWKDCAE